MRYAAEYARAVELRDRGLSLAQIARALGVPYGTVKGWMNSRWATPDMRPPRVPNAPLREAFLASGLTPTEVCRRLGWERRTVSRDRIYAGVDTTLLLRTLGLRRWVGRPGAKASYQVTVALERAQHITAALGLDFDELYPDLTMAVVEEPAGTCEECGLDLLWPAQLCGFCLSPVDRAERAMWQEAA